ncbi:MAG: TATA-box-binding protein [Promethearchaeia archaeon]|nr:MAG: TATA-box-binding protein [Candidatus Lokiarchaeia archaeon]
MKKSSNNQKRTSKSISHKSPSSKSSSSEVLTSHSKPKLPNKLILRIENIVATIDIHILLDLTLLTQKFKDIEPKDNFPGVITRFSKPKATLLIFSSGKIVVTGVRLESHLPIILEKTLKKLRKAGLVFNEEPEFHIENMVGRADFGTKINLDLSSISLESAIYEPEVFPGLIYKVSKPTKICFLIFSSGKVICTGANNLTDIQNSLKQLARYLKTHELLGENSQDHDIEAPIEDNLLDL